MKTDTRHYLIGIGILAVTFVSAVGVVAYQEANKGSWVSSAVDNTLMVQAYDPNGIPMWRGSGVIIGPGLVATAGHVVGQGQSQIPGYLELHNKDITYRTTIWAAHPTMDIAILYVPYLTSPEYPVWGELSDVEIGDPIRVIGHPGGMEQVWVTEGILSNYANWDSGLWPEVAGGDVAVIGGSSGSGVYDRKGRLVGILVGKYQGLCFITDFRFWKGVGHGSEY
ncbi:MAG: serine protease [Dehalococcoidales bacterium]|nr:serine protease [Dehalococcoidales bacterium]